MFQWKLAAILFLFGLNNSFAAQGVIDKGQEIYAKNSDFYNNTLINNGLIFNINADADEYDNPPSKTLINNSNILLKYEESFIRNVAIHNKPSGTIVLMNVYLEAYRVSAYNYYPSQIINEGNILIPEKNIVDSDCYWTASFQGEIINKPTGRLIATRDSTKCPTSPSLVPTSGDTPSITNSGYIEIGPKAIWDTSLASSGGGYSQNGGELHVDGLLSAKNFGFSGGKLSGNGTIKGNFPGYIRNTTISPGGPINSVGTLKIHSTETTKPLVFVGDIDIDIQGLNNYDKLVITAPAVDFANATINIKMPPTFLPPNTASFDIIQASNSIDPGLDIRLPDLSNIGVRLDIQNTGNTIKLIMTRI